MKLFASKRGIDISLDQIVLGVLALTVGVLTIFWYTNAFGDTELVFDRGLCKSSVISAHSSIVAGFDSPEGLNGCDSHVLDINYGESKIKEDGRVSRISTTSEEEASKIVSEELGGCAWQFGEGEYNPFGKYSDFRDHVRCVICSDIHFSPEFVSKIDSLDISSHMWKNEFKYFDTKKPYSEVLGFSTEFPKLALEKSAYPVDYSIIYGLGQTNPVYNYATISAAAGGTVGAFYGCKFGAALGASVGVWFAGAGAAPGAVIGCIIGIPVGAISAAALTYGGARVAGEVKDASVGEIEYFDNAKSYEYFFIKDHKAKEGYSAAFAIMPTEEADRICKRLY